MSLRSRSHVKASMVLTRADHLFIHNYIRSLLNNIVIGCSHDACFACRTNKCWTEFFKIIDSVQHLLGFLFFSSYSKNRKYPIFCWTEINAGPKYLTIFGNVYNIL